ncbi:MAG TPA: hypothetical protein VGM75_30640, partial [Pseudonocardiaceae bacterium]
MARRAAAARGQWDIWQAAFGPQVPDGYPSPIWDKQTGVIDHEVVAYRERTPNCLSWSAPNWQTLGPKISGRLHMYVGIEDTYFHCPECRWRQIQRD